MAKLPNFVEKDRGLFSICLFVIRESVKGGRKYSLFRYVFAGIRTALSFVEFGVFALIINEFSQRGVSDARTSVLIAGTAIIALAELIPNIISSVEDYFWTMQQQALDIHLQSLEFNKMNELDIGTIEQSEFQNMLSVVNSRAWNSFFSVNTTIVNSIRNTVAVIISAVSLYVISPLALAIVFFGSLPTYFIERHSAKLSAFVWKENSEKRRMWGAKVGPVFNKNSLVELKNLNLVKIFLKKFVAIISAFHQKVAALEYRNLRNDALGRIIIAISYGIALAFIIHKVYLGLIAVGALVFSFNIISRFQQAVNNLFDAFGRVMEHKEHLNVFLDFLEMKPLIASGEKVLVADSFESLELRNVSFTYPGSEQPVTHNLSLTINRGDNIAIVGLNGAGKTTLIKLLTRVYDPTEGEILVNGVNLKDYDLESWKRCMGILLQDYSIYSEESIAENIMLGDISKHDQETVEQSAKDSAAHDFIVELSEKYQQRVGTEFSGGVELSKGQKQKLALARVFYRGAPIVILDEPTAAIDALSEDAIFRNLRQNHDNQTRIIISHKFSNVRDADKIILIEHGKIIEQGTHDDLMKIKKGKYKELFELQAEGYK